MSASSRIAIVTGGSRGIGRDAVLRLAERGIASIITYHSRADDAEKVVAASGTIASAKHNLRDLPQIAERRGREIG